MTANIVCACIGIALFILFIGTILVWIKAIPLIVIVIGVVVAMTYDVILSVHNVHG